MTNEQINRLIREKIEGNIQCIEPLSPYDQMQTEHTDNCKNCGEELGRHTPC